MSIRTLAAWMRGHGLELAAIASTVVLAIVVSPWFAVLAALAAGEAVRQELRGRHRRASTPPPVPATTHTDDDRSEATA